MIKLTVKNVKQFQNFLSIISKFTSQCELNIYKDRCETYCKNLNEYSSARFDTITNLIFIQQKQKYDCIKLCIRDVNALRSSMNIISLVESAKEQITLNIQEIITPQKEIFGRKISYNGKAKFNLITIDRQIIENYIGNIIKADIDADIIWSFNIDPKKLDIIQNRTNSIINMDDVSVYIQDNEENEVICSLMAKQSSYNNSISLPIADSYTGSIDSIRNVLDLCISGSSFRLINILKVTNSQNLKGSYNKKYNFFRFDSDITKDNFYIKSRVLVNIVKGK